MSGYFNNIAKFLSVRVRSWIDKITHSDIVDSSYDFSSPEFLSETLLIKKCRKLFDKVGAVPDTDVSFETVLKVLNEAECLIASRAYFFYNAEYFVVDPDLRKARENAAILIHEFVDEMRMRKDVFEKLAILQQKEEPMKPEAKRYLDKLILMGKRNGLHLDEISRKQVKELRNEIDELEISFIENLKTVRTLEFSEQELDGLPSDFTGSLKKNVDSGKLEVILEDSSFLRLMKECKVPETRKRFEFSFNTRCLDANGSILEELRRLRHQLAVLLGYPNYADYSTEILMAKSAENVSKFLSELAEKFTPLWNEEKKYFLKLKEKECAELGIPFDGKLNSWDVSYYNRRAKEIKYPIDKKQLREYFPLPAVKEGLLSIYQDLLGLKFAKIGSVWHEDVEFYSVSDFKTESILGYFVLDLLPRPNKNSHHKTLAFPLQDTFLLSDGVRLVPTEVVTANFSKPKTDVPALLEHDEVVNFFHAFGHVMHHVCMEIEFAHFNLINVERDFTEMLPQMLENWCWEKESLKKMSSHYLDKSEIPDDILNALIKSRFANNIFETLNCILFSTYDQCIHTNPEGDSKELYYNLKKILGIERQEGTHLPFHFAEVANGYQAKWYTFLWNKVYSMDLFKTGFREKNILNPDVGKDFRDKILKPGGTKDAYDLMVSFLGREPAQDAFLLSRGLKI